MGCCTQLCSTWMDQAVEVHDQHASFTENIHKLIIISTKVLSVFTAIECKHTYAGMLADNYA